MSSVTVTIAVCSTVQKPRASVADTGRISNRRRAVTTDEAIGHRIWQGLHGCTGRSGRRLTGTRWRRWRRRRYFLERFRRRKNGSDLQRMSQRRRSSIVFLNYMRQIFIAGYRNQGFQVSVRQWTPQRHRRTTELHKLHHQLCKQAQIDEQNELIDQDLDRAERFEDEISKLRKWRIKPEKDIEGSTARTLVWPPT